MHRILAVIERDLRRFRRSPTLLIMTMIMPLLQLVVLGYAFGGKVRNLKLGLVDQDHHVPALKLREMCLAIAANARTFTTISYADPAAALRDLREGRINGVLAIPPEFSRAVLAGENPAWRWSRTTRTSSRSPRWRARSPGSSPTTGTTARPPG